jgi:hypothetical protein
MAKEVFGEFAAYTTPGGIRFQHKNKLISEKAVPPEVVSFLRGKLDGQRGQVERPKPTPAELAAIRAEQLAPKPGLEATPEKLEADAQDALTPDDFDMPPTADEGAGELPAHIQKIEEPRLDPSPVLDPSFIESVSIHTAPLEDIVEAIYNRFGIYTVYLRKLPEGDEINPLTGTPFSKYHLGIAYQAAIFAQNKGVLDLPAESNRKVIDQGRAASAGFKVDPRPTTMGEARRANSFDYRTSVRANEGTPTTEIVHITGEDGIVKAVQRVIPAGELGNGNGAAQRYDTEEDERIVEPQFGKQVIRPDW